MSGRIPQGYVERRCPAGGAGCRRVGRGPSVGRSSSSDGVPPHASYPPRRAPRCSHLRGRLPGRRPARRPPGSLRRCLRDILIEKGVLVKIGQNLHISSGNTSAVQISKETKDASIDDLFESLKDSIKSKDNNYLIQALENFRDILQEKEIPLTTIFFEIRKIIERLEKGIIDRNEVKEIVESWYEKYKALT